MKTVRKRRLNKAKRLRVIQITGLRGILSAIFFVTCLVAGFVAFPSIVICKLWNIIMPQVFAMPMINFFQGLILWGIVAISYAIINQRDKYFVAFEPKTMSGRDITDIIREIKAQSVGIPDENNFSNIDSVTSEDKKAEDNEEIKR